MKIEQLRKFFLALTMQERWEFAKKCGTSPHYINQIYGGQRVCNPTLAIEIEKHSNGAVKCDILSPKTDFEYIRQQAIAKLKAPSGN